MENESPQKGFAMPMTPLNQLSPERINQRLPQSPSFNSFLIENEPPRNRDSISSDVQSKVAFLNSLNGNSSPTRQYKGITSPPGNAALQRAILGYEEAQATLATITAENDRMKSHLASSQKRERMIAERIESLMEELQAERHKRSLDKDIYVKEIKKARKETYKAEFGQVEAREELKEARHEIKRVAAELTHEKAEKEKARQEAFERAYALAGVMEEIEVLKEKLKSAEKEKESSILQLNAYSISNQDEEILTNPIRQTTSKKVNDQPKSTSHKSQISRQIEDPDLTPKPIPRTTQQPHKTGPSRRLDHTLIDSTAFDESFYCMEILEKQSDGKEITLEDQIKVLKQELKWSRQENDENADMINFLHIQCQFKACPCRMAEFRDEKFVHDYAYERRIQEEHNAKKQRLDEDQKFRKLPPEPTPKTMAKVEEDPIVEEAIQIPLPEPIEVEIDIQNVTLDVTAQLEEITQVIVETNGGSKPFSFSTSTSSHVNHSSVECSDLTPSSTSPSMQSNTTPIIAPVRQLTNATEIIDSDLFNLSPPKHIPARPSTSLGILTTESPIRLVPESPQTNPIPSRSRTPNGVRPLSQSQTTKVALKNSPTKQHRRAYSRPTSRSQSRTRSPLVTTDDIATNKPSPSASPASTTAFPMTPVLKQSRSHHTLSSLASPAMSTTTTTVMVPLRADDEDIESIRNPATISDFNSFRSSTNENSTTAISVPGTPVSREAALAQIRARRDRARSVNLKNQINNNSNSTLKGAPGSAKRGVILDRGRDVSQASAPGRFGS